MHDLVDGLISTMSGDYDHPMNIGNPVEFTIKEFAEEVRRLIGSDS